MLEFSIIFVAGVHGAGKGYVSSFLSDKLGIPSYSASSLIRAEKKHEVDINKRVVDAGENQNHLNSALEKLRPNSEYILLDGHFCLQGNDQIIDIPISVFQTMKLKAFVVLQEEPELIVKRLLDRDGSALSVAEVKALQDAELDRAEMVSELLGVPLFIECSSKLERIAFWIDGHLNIRTFK